MFDGNNLSRRILDRFVDYTKTSACMNVSEFPSRTTD